MYFAPSNGGGYSGQNKVFQFTPKTSKIYAQAARVVTLARGGVILTALLDQPCAMGHGTIKPANAEQVAVPYRRRCST